MLGRRGVVSANNDLNLGGNAGSSCLVSADEVEGTSALTVKTHDLGERLSNNHLEALVNEIAETVGIIIKGAGGETLVSSVKERIKLVLLAHFSNLVPLLLGGVNTGGVVGTGVQEHSRAYLGIGKILQHAFDVETLG